MSETKTEPLALPAGVDRVSDLGTLKTLKESAEMLGLSAKTVRRMITRGELLGSHQVPMSNGKGLQWVVPYSELVKHENTVKAQAPAPNAAATELVALREQVARLQVERDQFEMLAKERAHSLEQLHLTVRLSLNSGDTPKKKLFWRK
jgi:hypothetical protein